MTKAQILKQTGLTEQEFYKLYPTQQHYQMAMGGRLYADGGGLPPDEGTSYVQYDEAGNPITANQMYSNKNSLNLREFSNPKTTTNWTQDNENAKLEDLQSLKRQKEALEYNLQNSQNEVSKSRIKDELNAVNDKINHWETYGVSKPKEGLYYESNDGMNYSEKGFDNMSFNSAFGEARKQGMKTFTWRGKSYGTNLKGESTKSSGKIPPPVVSEIKGAPRRMKFGGGIGDEEPRPVVHTGTANNKSLFRQGLDYLGNLGVQDFSNNIQDIFFNPNKGVKLDRTNPNVGTNIPTVKNYNSSNINPLYTQQYAGGGNLAGNMGMTGIQNDDVKANNIYLTDAEAGLAAFAENMPILGGMVKAANNKRGAREQIDRKGGMGAAGGQAFSQVVDIALSAIGGPKLSGGKSTDSSYAPKDVTKQLNTSPTQNLAWETNNNGGLGMPQNNTLIDPNTEELRKNVTDPNSYVTPELYPNAYGGRLNFAAGGALTEINTGGTHEQNPMGGVMVGRNASVEQGEALINKDGKPAFVLTDRIKLDSTTAEEFGLPKKYIGKTFSDIGKAENRVSDLRPNDPLTKDLLKSRNEKLEAAQEAQKARMAEKHMAKAQELAPEMFQQAQPQGMPQEQMAMQDPAMEQMMAMQGQGMPQGMPQQPMMASGGRMFARGGTFSNEWVPPAGSAEADFLLNEMQNSGMWDTENIKNYQDVIDIDKNYDITQKTVGKNGIFNDENDYNAWKKRVYPNSSNTTTNNQNNYNMNSDPRVTIQDPSVEQNWESSNNPIINNFKPIIDPLNPGGQSYTNPTRQSTVRDLFVGPQLQDQQGPPYTGPVINNNINPDPNATPTPDSGYYTREISNIPLPSDKYDKASLAMLGMNAIANLGAAANMRGPRTSGSVNFDRINTYGAEQAARMAANDAIANTRDAARNAGASQAQYFGSMPGNIAQASATAAGEINNIKLRGQQANANIQMQEAIKNKDIEIKMKEIQDMSDAQRVNQISKISGKTVESVNEVMKGMSARERDLYTLQWMNQKNFSIATAEDAKKYGVKEGSYFYHAPKTDYTNTTKATDKDNPPTIIYDKEKGEWVFKVAYGGKISKKFGGKIKNC